MVGKLDHIKSFKVDDDFSSYLTYLQRNLPDWSLAKIIRQSILLAAPFILAHPECADRIGIPRVDCQ
jgi:hypothetical protein